MPPQTKEENMDKNQANLNPGLKSKKSSLPKKILLLGGLLLILSILTGLLIYFKKPLKSFPQAQITITSQGFDPQTLLIKKGTRVTWINQDTSLHQLSSDPHPLHSSLPSLSSSALQKNQSYSFTFDSTGNFTYHDEKNPLKLKGTVVVQD